MSANSFLLYLNLWGTTAKLSEGGELGSRADLEACQELFSTALMEFVGSVPSMTYAKLADVAYVHGADLNELTRIAAKLFLRLLLSENGFHFWPLRGAIGRGGGPDEQFHGPCLLGPSSVEVARLEKSAQKGVRLFAEATLIEELEKLPGCLVQPRTTRNFAHLEINWLELANSELTSTTRLQLESDLRARAEELFEVGTNYSQQMAGSVLEMVRWSQRN